VSLQQAVDVPGGDATPTQLAPVLADHLPAVVDAERASDVELVEVGTRGRQRAPGEHGDDVPAIARRPDGELDRPRQREIVGDEGLVEVEGQQHEVSLHHPADALGARSRRSGRDGGEARREVGQGDDDGRPQLGAQR